MTPRRFGLPTSLLAAALAAGAISPPPAPVAAAPFAVSAAPAAPFAVSAAPAAQAGEMTPPVTQAQRVQINVALLRAFRDFGHSRRVWAAVAKRGNRRGRARWNYNR